ncbi:MAG TPA: glycosyl hydrolase, partial [Hanamia sp.]
GSYIADVAYFIGEDAPKMTGTRDPELPKGYSYDYMNAEVIENRMHVKDGRLTLTDGMNYGILVLPKLKTMRPEVLKKIRQLVNDGAVILGPKPDHSPSLENYPDADKEIKRLASELWGNIDEKNVKVHHYGKGMVIDGMDMQEALNLIKVPPDYKTDGDDSTLFIHRKLSNGDIYFVSNQTEKTISINPKFRTTGKRPEIWNAIDGSKRDLPEYSYDAEGTSVPLKLEPLQSAFIVFRKPASTSNPKGVNTNFPNPESTKEISDDWLVKFDHKMRGPKNAVIFHQLTDWTKNENDSIKYYSGTAVYTKTIQSPKVKNGEKIFLDLGDLIAMAKVKVNGIYVGGAWTPPYEVDITNALKPGQNTLEISVVNNWMNRLIGDLNLPGAERKTWVSIDPYIADSPLQASGLFGPVVLKVIKY